MLKHTFCVIFKDVFMSGELLDEIEEGVRGENNKNWFYSSNDNEISEIISLC